MKSLILFFLVVLNLEGLAQESDCRYFDRYVKRGDSIANSGDANFEAAINAYSTAMLHCPAKADSARQKILEVFRKIDNLKKKAEQAQKTANEALSAAKSAKEEAIKQGEMVLVSKLTAQAEVIRNNFPSLIERSVLLALKSILVKNTLEAEEVLRKSLAQFPRVVNKSAHIESIGNMFVSADNKWLATVSSDTTAAVWSIETGKKIFEVNLERVIKFIVLDSQSKYLATLNSNNNVVLWELKSGKEIYRFKNQSKIKEQSTVSISNRTRVIRRPTSRLTRKNGLAFSPDGRYLAMASEDSTVRLVDISSLKTRFTLKSSSPVNDIKFSPNGEFIASKTDSIINVWKVATGEEKFRIDLNNGAEQFAFDPKGSYLAITASDTNEIAALWNIHTGEKIGKVGDPIRDGRGNLLGFSPDGGFLWTTTNIGTVIKWDVKTQREKVRIPNDGFGQQLLSISLDGKYIATAGAGNMARMWNASDGSEVAKFIQEGEILSVIFIDSSKYLAATSIKGGVKIWETQNVNPVAKFNQPYLKKISFSDDEKFLLTYGGDVGITNSTNIWNIPAKVRMFHKRYPRGLFDAVISNNGKFLYSTSGDSVWKYDLETGEILSKIKLEGDYTLSASDPTSVIALSPNGHYLIKTFSGRGLLWKIDTGSRLMRLGLSHNIMKAAFSPDSDNSHLVTISVGDSSKHIVEIFDLKNEKSILTQQFDPGTISEPYTPPVFAISYDGKYIVFPDRDTRSSARVVNLKNKEELKLLNFPKEFDSLITNDRLTAFAFSPDGEYLIGGQANGNVSVFNIQNGNEVARVNNLSGSTITQVLFSPGQNYIATAEEDSFAQVWLWRQDDLIKAACSCLTRNFTFGEWKRYFGEKPYERVCPNLPPHPSLLEKAEGMARSGDIDGAVKIINMDVSLRDSLKMEPKKWAMELAAKEAAKEAAKKAAKEAAELVRAGLNSARKGAINQAIESFSKAQKIDPTIKISASYWNDLAWYVAIRNQPALVTEAIDRALKLEPDNGAFRDTRGVIRALTGDIKGAIEDFEYYLNWAPDNRQTKNDISKREEWIKELNAGQNPLLNPKTLKGLITPF